PPGAPPGTADAPAGCSAASASASTASSPSTTAPTSGPAWSRCARGTSSARRRAPVMRTELAVIGAGPAGIAAALAAARRGTRVTLVDAAPAPGGQYFRQPAPGLGEGVPQHSE